MNQATTEQTNADNQRITLDGVELFYRQQGSGPPLLLVHGYGANTANWRLLMPELARRHRVIALDLKGFGQSAKPDDGAYGLQQQADLVTRLIDELQLLDVTLVGHSMGGGVALLAALSQLQSQRQAITRLVLIDGIAYPQRLPPFIRILRLRWIGELAIAIAPARLISRLILRFAYYDPAKVSEVSIAAYAAPITCSGGRQALLQSARQIIPGDIDWVTARYPQIELPTLILWGDHDRIVPLSNGQRLQQEMTDARLEVIKDCGHIPQEEQPEVTLALLQQFIQGQSSSGSTAFR